ncbi:unknown protein [Seminavis robusta]|uniref:Uncharacterized protein n=1 Tax=Seminavis robusta TaxID=568900 RepID=A0A9N8EGA2_9STRA|nr:unknown protein [Seminavis robusta]|eukprot:Sro1145_g246200.1 n/a (153) ;mRNA; r:15618-16076
MHLRPVQAAFCLAATASLHGSLPLRVIAWTPQQQPSHANANTTPSRRAFLQTSVTTATIWAGGTSWKDPAMAVQVTTTEETESSSPALSASSSFLSSTSSDSFSSSNDEEDSKAAARRAREEEKARKAAEKEAKRLAEETKKRLAVGRIGTI